MYLELVGRTTVTRFTRGVDFRLHCRALDTAAESPALTYPSPFLAPKDP